MGQIDVSDLLADPDMIDRVILVRRAATVGTDGKNSVTEEQIPTWASVQPADNKAIQRLPEELRVMNLKSFHIKATIVSDGTAQDGTSRYPDVIIHKGIRYQVTKVFDWTNWGAGWSEGVCIQQKAAR